MTVDEVYATICKSNDQNCYSIAYLINNYRIEEAICKILSCFDCDNKTAEEVSYRFKEKLGK